MDRSRTKEFRDVALLLEGCLRAYAEKLAIQSPDNPVGRAIYRAFPAAQRLVGKDPQFPYFVLDPETCRSAITDGSTPPAPSEFHSVRPTDPEPDVVHFHGGMLDSARILGRIEKGQRAEIGDVLARWLAAERRRDTPNARRLFVDALARRILEIESGPLPGADPGKLAPDSWSYLQMLADRPRMRFAEAAAGAFSAAGEADDPAYPGTERFVDMLLGGRLCGHVEGLARFPMAEIMSRFGRHPPDSEACANLAAEFGRHIAASAMEHPSPWSESTDAIVPGLHEHLAQLNPGRRGEPPAPLPGL